MKRVPSMVMCCPKMTLHEGKCFFCGETKPGALVTTEDGYERIREVATETYTLYEGKEPEGDVFETEFGRGWLKAVFGVSVISIDTDFGARLPIDTILEKAAFNTTVVHDENTVDSKGDLDPGQLYELLRKTLGD